MKLKLLIGAAAIFSSINFANAGLISGDTEWLDLSLTNNLNYSELTDLLAKEEYSNYSLATLEQVNALFLPVQNEITQGSTANGYFDFSHVTSQQSLDVFAWIRGGRAEYPGGYGAATTVNTNEFIESDIHYSQYLSFGDAVTKPCEGFERDFGICDPDNLVQGHVTGIFGMVNDANNPNRFMGTVARENSAYNLAGNTSHIYDDADKRTMRSWLVTRDVNGTTDIPEPSTLAIFALGLVGLVSRRFKK